jgi:hypothetical protein
VDEQWLRNKDMRGQGVDNPNDEITDAQQPMIVESTTSVVGRYLRTQPLPAGL